MITEVTGVCKYKDRPTKNPDILKQLESAVPL